MDEQNEASGQTLTPDTREYQHRTLGILNVLRHELYPFSDTWVSGEAGKRSICPEIHSFDEDIGLDDALAQGALPYGLAAVLLLGENDAMANYFSQRYLELVTQLRQNLPAQFEEIPLAYGGLEG